MSLTAEDEDDLQLERALTKHAEDETHHRIHKDGRVDISFKRPFDPTWSKRFFARASHQRQGTEDVSPPKIKSRPLYKHTKRDFKPPVDDFSGVPPLNIAILVVGSRGDVQPFIALGKVLAAPPYNHRVRIVTHPVFKDFVQGQGLEFFSMGGDPEKLMSYAVRNPGIMPSYESIKAGEIGARRAEIAEMLEGAWLGCTTAGTDAETLSLMVEKQGWKNEGLASDTLLTLPEPFVANAIIANPPSYASIHIAEKLGIPLHMMFTMPWSPTTEFPHPLANLDASKVDAKIANYLSYIRLELLTWRGLEDLINRFREKTLFLDPIHTYWGSTLFPHLRVPFTYCWSPALIPKPSDWASHISISGFFFLGLASSYQPDLELQKFLDAGEPPVYIGFGSIVVDDPAQLNSIVFDAIKKTGVRALVSRGWAKLGIDPLPSNVFLLGNVPHDWLFPRCSAVVHHGGAGTTAIGIALGKPTIIVPFFGDQGWWAGMIARSGAGPKGVPWKQLTSDILAENIQAALHPDMKARAEELATKISHEDGTRSAAEFFHQQPQMQNLRCFLYPQKPAIWRIRRTNIQLSNIAAGLLIRKGILEPGKLKLMHHREWRVDDGPQGPLLAALGTLQTTVVGIAKDATQFERDLAGAIHDHKYPSSPNISDTSKKDTTSQDNTICPNRTDHPPPKRTIRHALSTVTVSTTAHIVQFPITLLYNLANGFHNFPATILRDPTIRAQEPIKGIGSGFRASVKGFLYGNYDAVTGLIVHPVREFKAVKDDGSAVDRLAGLGKGLAQGLGGLVFKAAAAGVGVPAYLLKGVQREVESRMTKHDEELMRAVKSFKGRLAVPVPDGSNGATNHHQDESSGKNAVVMEDDGLAMWKGSVRGSHADAYVKMQLTWAGFRDWRNLLLNEPKKAKEIEKEVIQRWDRLNVSKEYVR